jgi:hypothetical protein
MTRKNKLPTKIIKSDEEEKDEELGFGAAENTIPPENTVNNHHGKDKKRRKKDALPTIEDFVDDQKTKTSSPTEKNKKKHTKKHHHTHHRHHTRHHRHHDSSFGAEEFPTEDTIALEDHVDTKKSFGREKKENTPHDDASSFGTQEDPTSTARFPADMVGIKASQKFSAEDFPAEDIALMEDVDTKKSFGTEKKETPRYCAEEDPVSATRLPAAAGTKISRKKMNTDTEIPISQDTVVVDDGCDNAIAQIPQRGKGRDTSAATSSSTQPGAFSSLSSTRQMEAFTSSSARLVAPGHDIESLGSEEASPPVIQAHMVNESFVEGIPVEPDTPEALSTPKPEPTLPFRNHLRLLVAVLILVVVIVAVVLGIVLTRPDPDPNREPTSPPSPTRTTPPMFNVPFTTNALSFSKFNETSEKLWGDCDTGTTVDAEYTTVDKVCQSTGPCHIAYVEPGEWLEYDFLTDSGYMTTLSDGTQGMLVDITVRVASLSVKVFVSTYYGYTE